jgi:DNA-binding transcriptional ArsR family regulator
VEVRSDPRATAPRAVDLRRGRGPEVEILACDTYDFLVSLHVSLASPEHDYADYDVGRAWVEGARARCNARDASALSVLGRYLGGGEPGSLHATLLSLVRQCPEPRDTAAFLSWLQDLPAGRLAEVLIDQEGLGADWQALLAAALAEVARLGQPERPSGTVALSLLLARYPEDVRPTVAAVVCDVEAARLELVAALRVWDEAVFAEERARVAALQAREATVLERRRAEISLDAFIEEAMHGVHLQRPTGVRRIVFAPSYFCRPAVVYHVWQGTMTFCIPIEAKVLEPETERIDPGAPDEATLAFFVALGDETRLRILRLLSEREMYLTELADRLGLTKATTKHHMVRLRAAGLVTLYDRERLTYYALRPHVAQHAAQLLDAYLVRPSVPKPPRAARQ